MCRRISTLLLLLCAVAMTTCYRGIGLVESDADHTGDSDRESDGDADADADADVVAPCLAEEGDDTVVLLTFDSLDGATFADTFGHHDAELRGDDGSLIPGRPGCGAALRIPEVHFGGAYVVIPDSADFQLSAGSIEVQVRFDVGSHGGILGRDEDGMETNGHLTLRRSIEGGLSVRLQHEGGSYTRCSDFVSPDVWHHVAVNFGPPNGLELFVDGRRATSTEPATFTYGWPETSGSIDCGDTTATTAGIAGNINPWILGASGVTSLPASSGGVYSHFGGAMDHFRVSSVPRDFER